MSRFPNARDAPDGYFRWLTTYGVCVNCGDCCNLQVAHVISRAKGGYDYGGTVPMCATCHGRQHTKGWDALDISQADAALHAIVFAIRWRHSDQR